MNEFEITAVVEQTAERVLQYLTDVEQVPRWNATATEIRVGGGGPIQEGAKLIARGHVLGRSVDSIPTCTTYEPGIRFARKTTSGPFHLEVDNELTPTEGGTRLRSTYRGESRVFFKLAQPIVVRLTKHQFETNAQNLKELGEADT